MLLQFLLIVTWGIGYFLYEIASGFIHLLLIVAVVAILVNVYKHRKLN